MSELPCEKCGAPDGLLHRLGCPRRDPDEENARLLASDRAVFGNEYVDISGKRVDPRSILPSSATYRPQPSPDPDRSVVIKQFDRFSAVFQPQRVDDLRYGVKDLIGRRLEWQAAWVIGGQEDHDNGVDPAYDGQFACAILSEVPADSFFAWAPSGDLVDIQPLPEDPSD